MRAAVLLLLLGCQSRPTTIQRCGQPPEQPHDVWVTSSGGGLQLTPSQSFDLMTWMQSIRSWTTCVTSG